MSPTRKKSERAPDAGSGDSKPLILVVDDFEDNRKMYAQYLVWSGYKVAEAANGQEAIDQTFKLAPDLVVMDLSLPGLDGWEATRRLKKDERTRDIPVIALTGHALAGHSKGAADAGCDAFLTKPCLPAALVEAVEKMIALRPKRRGRR